VNSLPKTVIRQHRDCDLNPGPSVPESSTLTTWLPGERTKVQITLWTVVFIATAAVIYCLGHGLCTFTGVPRSTQPSTLCGTVN